MVLRSSRYRNALAILTPLKMFSSGVAGGVVNPGELGVLCAPEWRVVLWGVQRESNPRVRVELSLFCGSHRRCQASCDGIQGFL